MYTLSQKRLLFRSILSWSLLYGFCVFIWVLYDACESNWLERMIQCDCPRFQKDFYCKHSIGLAVLQKFATVPESAKYDIEQIGKWEEFFTREHF